jgi:histidine triad (HIT) family protein
MHTEATFDIEEVCFMKNDCLFCKIVNGKTNTQFLYEDDTLVVFKDKYPYKPVHLLIVPKKHIRSVNDLQTEHQDIVAKMILKARDMAKEFNFDQDGYKLLFNVERGGGQVIFHLHLHLMSEKD